jgi:hypothetical protein
LEFVMGIRENLNNNQRLTSGVAGVVVVLAIAAIVWQAAGGGTNPVLTAKALYSSDDGKTWFADAIYKPTPFDHGGKPAYGAIVVRCGGAEPRVAFLTRLSDAFLQEARALKNTEPDFVMRFEALQRQGLEVRKPGAKAWHPVDSPAGQRLVEDATKCPDGSTPEPLIP